MKIIEICDFIVRDENGNQKHIDLDEATDSQRIAIALKLLEDCDDSREYKGEENFVVAAIANLSEIEE